MQRTSIITPPTCTLLNKLCPFEISVCKSHPLNNSETLWDIFLKLGTNIKHRQTMSKEKYRNFVYSFFFFFVFEWCPFVNCDHPSDEPDVWVFYSQTLGDTLTKLGSYIKHFSGNVHSTSTVTPPTLFYGIMFSLKFQYANRARSITLKPFEIFSWKLVQI